MLVSLLGFLFVLIVVVFVHEMGHYLAAKMQGIHVEVFSLGFGKELFRYTDKFGTRWQLSIVPLGGYVKFLGDDDVFSVSNHGDECKKKGSFSAAGNWRKIAVVLAGPFANFVLAAVIFSGLAFVYGKVSTARTTAIFLQFPAAEKLPFFLHSSP
jgi:regulator of sigma E protease